MSFIVSEFYQKTEKGVKKEWRGCERRTVKSVVKNEGYDHVELDNKAKEVTRCKDAITIVRERSILSFAIEIAS